MMAKHLQFGINRRWHIAQFSGGESAIYALAWAEK